MNSEFLNEVLPALERAAPGSVVRSASLAPLARWKIGGRATAVVEPKSADEVAAILEIMANRPEPLFVMGDASNILFDSAGFSGIVLRISGRMGQAHIEGCKVYAQAGCWVPQLAHRVGMAGLSGIEHTIGIPGTIGGLLLMNGGSKRKGIGLNVTSVDCLSRDGERFSMDRAACGFSYRKSTLQAMSCVVVGVHLTLEAGNRESILREMINIMISRRDRFPKHLPNAGSTFLSDPTMYESVGAPGQIIEKIGLKGVTRGGAQISPQHANFIVNIGGATSEDVLSLVHLVRQRAFEATGYLMDCEVRFVSANGRVRPAHEAAEELFGQIG